MRVVFLQGAEEDLKELRRYIIKSFGRQVWQESYQHIKDGVRIIRSHPQGGAIPDELAEVSLGRYRQVMAGKNRIIYEIREDIVVIHIVCDTRRNLQSLLSRRLLRPER